MNANIKVYGNSNKVSGMLAQFRYRYRFLVQSQDRMHTTNCLHIFLYMMVEFNLLYYTLYTLHSIIFASKLCHNVLTKIRLMFALYNN